MTGHWGCIVKRLPCWTFLRQLNFTIFKGRYFATLNFSENLSKPSHLFFTTFFFTSLNFCDVNNNYWCRKTFLQGMCKIYTI